MLLISSVSACLGGSVAFPGLPAYICGYLPNARPPFFHQIKTIRL